MLLGAILQRICVFEPLDTAALLAAATNGEKPPLVAGID
jgi:hypothetical protein